MGSLFDKLFKKTEPEAIVPKRQPSIREKAQAAMQEVLPNIFMGDAKSSNAVRELRSKGITHILAIGWDLEMHYPGEFDYMILSRVEDQPNYFLLRHFEPCFHFMDHCLKGVELPQSLLTRVLQQQTADGSSAIAQQSPKSEVKTDSEESEDEKHSPDAIGTVAAEKKALVSSTTISTTTSTATGSVMQRHSAEEHKSKHAEDSRGPRPRVSSWTTSTYSNVVLQLRDERSVKLKSKSKITMTPTTSSPISESLKKSESGIGTGKLLVHCHKGLSRSASVIIGYLMRGESLSFSTAQARIRESRSVIMPNIGFQAQLMEFEKQRYSLNMEVYSSLDISQRISELIPTFLASIDGYTSLYAQGKGSQVDTKDMFEICMYFHQVDMLYRHGKLRRPADVRVLNDAIRKIRAIQTDYVHNETSLSMFDKLFQLDARGVPVFTAKEKASIARAKAEGKREEEEAAAVVVSGLALDGSVEDAEDEVKGSVVEAPSSGSLLLSAAADA